MDWQCQEDTWVTNRFPWEVTEQCVSLAPRVPLATGASLYEPTEDKAGDLLLQMGNTTL
jgi:hypothetical protein